jgi:major membrane immunogen (membrane-anchored lipoprotein)
MRRIVLALCTTVTALVLLFSYRTSTDRSGAGGAVRAAGAGVAPAQPSAPPGSPGPSGSPGSSGGSSRGTVVDGSEAQTRWGIVQVQITVRNGKIVSARTIQEPNGNFRDQEINSQAVPILNQEVVQVQSAQIDTVSGATVTSDGYIESLQAALDAAHL